jgi:plasmid stabilization system protein ParE
MAYKYILHEHAQEDYETSLQWYAERSVQVGAGFAAAIEDALQLICEHPARWRNSYSNYHELGLKNYPFSIIYTIEPNLKLVVITSIYHHKRNPKKKYKK